MVALEDIKPGRWFSFVYVGELEMNVNKRWLSPGVSISERNPLLGRINVRKVIRGQAATAEMLMRKNLEINSNWTPSENYTIRWVNTDNPCVVESINNGKLQARLMSPITDKTDYFVDGRPATESEIQLALSYITPAKPKSPTCAKVKFPYVDSLVNVEQ
jgi:hypothetical protein